MEKNYRKTMRHNKGCLLTGLRDIDGIIKIARLNGLNAEKVVETSSSCLVGLKVGDSSATHNPLL